MKDSLQNLIIKVILTSAPLGAALVLGQYLSQVTSANSAGYVAPEVIDHEAYTIHEEGVVSLWPKTIDLGSKPLGSEVPFFFYVVNGTGGVVRLDLPTSDCTCTQLEMSKYVLQPGERTTVSGIRVATKPFFATSEVRVGGFSSDGSVFARTLEVSISGEGGSLLVPELDFGGVVGEGFRSTLVWGYYCADHCSTDLEASSEGDFGVNVTFKPIAMKDGFYAVSGELYQTDSTLSGALETSVLVGSTNALDSSCSDTIRVLLDVTPPGFTRSEWPPARLASSIRVGQWLAELPITNVFEKSIHWRQGGEPDYLSIESETRDGATLFYVECSDLSRLQVGDVFTLTIRSEVGVTKLRLSVSP